MLYGEPRVWLEQFPEGQATRIYCDHLGLRYPGEVIRAASWSSSWGEPLDQNVYFRIVLIGRRRGSLHPRISDARIAVCLPGTTWSRRRTSSIGELAAIRETQAIYLSSGDLDTDLIRTTLRRRQEGLEQELLGEESVRYTQGAVMTGADSTIDASHIFAGIDPNQWFQRLAGQLLGHAYPVLPVDTSSLDRAITCEDVAELHGAIFDHAGGNPDVLLALGPALGLSSHATPWEFDVTRCQSFDLLREWLSRQPAQADWLTAHHYLAHDIGLTNPLALLYLLLFVYSESPPLEIKLTSRDGVSTIDGGALLTRRLTNDLIPLLPWDPGIANLGAHIGRESAPEWEDTLQHLSYLSPNLAAHAGSSGTRGTDTATAEAVLAHDLESLSQELAQSHALVAQLYQATNEPELPELAGSLERLALILGDAPAGFSAVYRRIREVCPNPSSLGDDISIMHRVAELTRFSPDVLDLHSYLNKAEIPSSTMPDLWVKRQALQAALPMSSLIQPGGRTWESMFQEIEGFKSSYGHVYQSHHAEFHQALPAYQRDLEAARRKSQALTLLNTVSELSGSEGLGLAESLEELNDGPAPCPVNPEGLQLEEDPICDACNITLEQTLPLDGLNRIGSAFDSALAIKCGRLSDLLVGKIMQDAQDPDLDGLIKILHTSDLTALYKTVNQEMVDFIRRLLV